MRSFHITAAAVVMFIAILLVWLLTGCDLETKVEGRGIGKMIPAGELPLQKMHPGVNQQLRVETSWFLFGSASANAGPEARVYFSWRMNDWTYAISSLPLERIRMRTVESVGIPSISFALKPGCAGAGDPLGALHFATLQEGIDECVRYATITCAEKGWQPSVTLPLK